MELACIVMAAGQARRFGSNKLLQEFDGCPLCSRALAAARAGCFSRRILVTGYAAVAALAEDFTVVMNDRPELGISQTIRLGLAEAENCDGAMFLTADQPLLTGESLQRLVRIFQEQPDRICAAASGGKRGNPVVFPREFFSELTALEGDHGGAAVIRRHPDRLQLVEMPEWELWDCDTPQALETIKNGEKPIDKGNIC